MFIYILVYLGHINEHKEHSTKEVGALINDLLICIEMSMASVAFLHSFSVLDFTIPSSSTPDLETDCNDGDKKPQLIIHSAVRETRSKALELRLELSAADSMVLWDAMAHVFSQTELKTDLRDITAHVIYNISEFSNNFCRRYTKSTSKISSLGTRDKSLKLLMTRSIENERKAESFASSSRTRNSLYIPIRYILLDVGSRYHSLVTFFRNFGLAFDTRWWYIGAPDSDCLML